MEKVTAKDLMGMHDVERVQTLAPMGSEDAMWKIEAKNGREFEIRQFGLLPNEWKFYVAELVPYGSAVAKEIESRVGPNGQMAELAARGIKGLAKLGGRLCPNAKYYPSIAAVMKEIAASITDNVRVRSEAGI